MLIGVAMFNLLISQSRYIRDLIIMITESQKVDFINFQHVTRKINSNNIVYVPQRIYKKN